MQGLMHTGPPVFSFSKHRKSYLRILNHLYASQITLTCVLNVYDGKAGLKHVTCIYICSAISPTAALIIECLNIRRPQDAFRSIQEGLLCGPEGSISMLVCVRPKVAIYFEFYSCCLGINIELRYVIWSSKALTTASVHRTSVR